MTRVPARQWSREWIEGLLEDDLCQFVLVPLFEAMGFCDVRFVGGGSLEQGKDIVMWRAEPPRQRVNYAAVVKADRISGDTSTGVVLTQIKQAFGSPTFNSLTTQPENIHHCFVVTSDVVRKEGHNTLHSLLNADHLLDSVTVIDSDELWRLVQEYLPRKIIMDSLQRGFDGLNAVAPDYDFSVRTEGRTLSLSLLPRESDRFSVALNPQFDDTAEGKKKKDEFEAFLRTGAPVVLEKQNLPFNDLPDVMRQLMPDDVPYRITVGPGRPKKPIEMSIVLRSPSSEELTIPYVRFASIQAGSDSVTMVNDDQEGPFHCSLTLFSDRRSNMNYRFSLEGANVYWFEQMLRFQKLAAEGSQIFYRDLESGLEHMATQFAANEVEGPDEELLKVVERCRRVQQITKSEIFIPERDFFLPEDIAHLEDIEEIIDKGQTTTTATDVTLNLRIGDQDREPLKRSLESAVPLSFSHSNDRRQLLDSWINLGPVIVSCGRSLVHPDDVSTVRKALEGKQESISIRFIPEEGESFTFRWEKWPRSTTE